jgi:hypothetical protein
VLLNLTIAFVIVEGAHMRRISEEGALYYIRVCAASTTIKHKHHSAEHRSGEFPYRI